MARVYQRCNVKAGDIVCFWGHMGIVHRCLKSGFWSIEGNATDAVRLRWHAWSAVDTFGRVLFTHIPERFAAVAR